MSLMMIEMLLWVGFGLVLWAMRDDLMQKESQLRRPAHPRTASTAGGQAAKPSQPQQLARPIGQYLGRTIHEYAIIEGRPYRFVHVCPCHPTGRLTGDQRWVAPGLVYVECSVPQTI